MIEVREMAFVFATQLLIMSASVAYFTFSIAHGRLRLNDYMAAVATLCGMPLLVENLRMLLTGRSISTEHSVAVSAAAFMVVWTSKSSIVLSSTRMLNVSYVYGVRRWIVGSILVLAGFSYGVASALTCEVSPGSSEAIYACHPSGVLIVSSIASEIIVDFNIIGLFSDLFLEGFTFSLRTISSHKKRAVTMLASVAIMLVANTATMLRYMIQKDKDGIHAMRMLNVAPAVSLVLCLSSSFVALGYKKSGRERCCETCAA